MAKLYIENRNEFDQQVWQTETEFTNKDYNDWKNRASEALQRVYDCIDCDDPIDTADLYVLGDIINMLSAITIESEARPALVASLNDFDFRGYPTEDLDREEQDMLLTSMYGGVNNNDCIMDCYYQHIELIAEERGIEYKEYEAEGILDVNDVLDADFYTIEMCDGKKCIHLNGYFYEADDEEKPYRHVEASGCYIDIEELMSADDKQDCIDEAFGYCSQYMKDLEEKEADEMIAHYFDGQPPKLLRYEDITTDTPCGYYVNI